MKDEEKNENEELSIVDENFSDEAEGKIKKLKEELKECRKRAYHIEDSHPLMVCSEYPFLKTKACFNTQCFCCSAHTAPPSFGLFSSIHLEKSSSVITITFPCIDEWSVPQNSVHVITCSPTLVG